MAIKKQDVEANNAINENSASADKTASVYVSAGVAKNSQGENLTIVGFGGLKPYEQNGETKIPGAREVFYKLQNINNFLKATEASKVGVDIKGKDEKGQDMFIRADFNYETGISKSGKSYGFNKIYLTMQPEKTNEQHEVVSSLQKLYATKGINGYSFDKNCDDALIQKFNNAVKNGCEFTLSAKKDTTLEKYSKLVETLEHIKGGSANVKIAFVKQQGAVISSIEQTGKDGKTGENMIINSATKKKGKSIE